MKYEDFISSKAMVDDPTGVEPPELNASLYPFQRDIVSWALRRGRASIFADCGLGKTFMQLEWARVVSDMVGPVLIVAPLAVAQQTVSEGERFGIKCEYSRTGMIGQITITNYEMLEKFDPADFSGIVLDESSILKSYTGKFRNMIIENFGSIAFRLACTATPAPNDHMELGNHAEFCGVMSRTEMLSMFFVHDGGETQKWRLKGHAESEFWKWITSWAVMIQNPSNLGYEDAGFTLPPLNVHHITVEANNEDCSTLFAMTATTLQERIQARRDTIAKRSDAVAKMVNESDDCWLIWCNLNKEAETVTRLIDGAVNVHGSMKLEDKADKLMAFSRGEIRVLVTKPKIAGFGMNWQHCSNVAFLGLNDSWESYYQSVRRCWRFGQTSPVDVHIVTADIEGEVVRNIERKDRQAQSMLVAMCENMESLTRKNIKGSKRTMSENNTSDKSGNGWDAHLGDCVDVVSTIESDSIGYTIFSPPFASLYTYSNSDRDMGNCRTHSEFYEHFMYLIPELLRVTQPGRLLSFHCMNLPTSKARDGFIGISDFRGKLISMFIDAGWIFHSEVVIWKDPVTAMQRTKALGLLHKQICKDSAMSRQGIPDYLVTMRKPGTNPNPCAGGFTEFVGDQSTFKQTGNLSIDIWQRYASPVWMDINPSNTLQKRSAREEKDERHICPLQLDVIERGLQMWSMPGDTVLSPFMGIGSEGYCAIKMGRKFVGAALKESYWKQACKNLANAESLSIQSDLFADV
jgi:superfamily II DNA or RNA helicase